MYLPLIKVVWFGEISFSFTTPSLFVAHLKKILKLQLVTAIDLNLCIITSSTSFGIRVIRKKLRLNRSNYPLFQSFTSNILRYTGVPHANTTKDLNYLKKYQASWPTRSRLASLVPPRLALLSITMPWWTRPRRRVWLPRDFLHVNASWSMEGTFNPPPQPPPSLSPATFSMALCGT
jgi:hypothetical protein